MAETWGLLIDWIGNDYTQTIIDTALDFSAHRNLSLVVYTLGHLSFTLESDKFQSFVLPLTSDPHLDRLLICSAQMSSHGGLPILERHFGSFTTTPVVCLGGALCGFPVIQTDFSQAFTELLDHLRKVHRYRRFAWVGGPPDNPESRERERFFRNYLDRHQLPLDQRLFLTGNFTHASGKAAGIHLESLRGEWDVVVAANDSMAVSLREVLGPRAPVTGFDDSWEAVDHSLTTVNPYLPLLVEKALGLLSQLPAGKTERSGTVLLSSPAHCVRRSSCGCPEEPVTWRGRPKLDQSTERIGGLAQRILECQDLEEVECYLREFLPKEGINFWRLVPTKEAKSLTLERLSPIIPESPTEDPIFLIVHSLFVKEELLGYLVLDLKNRDFVLSEWLRVHVSLLLQSWYKKQDGVQAQKLLSLEIEKLERRKNDIEQIVNSLPVWLVELDRKFHIRYLNQTGEVFFGRPLSEVRYHDFLSYVTPDSQEDLRHRLCQCRDQSIKVTCLIKIRSGLGFLSVVGSVEPLGEDRHVNLSTLFGSLSFEGGVRLTGMAIRPLLEDLLVPDKEWMKNYALTERQGEILGFVAKGLDIVGIAKKVNLSESTIRVQLHNIYLKTGVSNKRELLQVIGSLSAEAGLDPQE